MVEVLLLFAWLPVGYLAITGILVSAERTRLRGLSQVGLAAAVVLFVASGVYVALNVDRFA